MLKKFMSILLTFTLIIGCLPVFTLPTMAATAWDGTSVASSFAGGSGTSDSPYEIATPAQLAYMASLINSSSTNSTYKNCSYKLTADIDLNSKQWTPIGSTGSTPFSGTFDGNGKTVSNLGIGTSLNYYTGYFNGLFGDVTGGTIQNVTIAHAVIYSKCLETGILAGLINNKSTISYCSTSGNIKSILGVQDVGGLIGLNAGNITGCYSTADVETTGNNQNIYLGGLVGTNNPGTINDSYASGAVRSVSSGNPGFGIVGGLVGYTSGTIINCYATGDVTSASLSGGFAGFIPSSVITNCYASGNVTGKTMTQSQISYIKVGGFGGQGSSNSTNTYCYWNEDATQTVDGTERDSSSKQGIGFLPTSTDTTTKETLTYMQSPDFAGLLNDYKGTHLAWRYNAGSFPTLNFPPMASDLSISGTYSIPNTLTAHYSFNDINGDTDSGSVIRWYRASDTDGTGKTEISSANNSTTYTLTDSDKDCYICFEVTPCDGLESGPTVTSGYTSAITKAISASVTPAASLTEENLDTNSLTVTLSGTTFADSNLDASNFTLNNAPAGVTIKSITYDNTAGCTVNLAYDATDFDSNLTDFSLTIKAAELSSGSDLTSNTLTIAATTETAPVVSTGSIGTYTGTTATVGGNVTSDGGETVTDRGVVYSAADTTPTIDEGAVQVSVGTGTGKFSKIIDSLTPETTYYVCAYAKNSVGTSYGSVAEFTTPKAGETVSPYYVITEGAEETNYIHVYKKAGGAGGFEAFTASADAESGTSYSTMAAAMSAVTDDVSSGSATLQFAQLGTDTGATGTLSIGAESVDLGSSGTYTIKGNLSGSGTSVISLSGASSVISDGAYILSMCTTGDGRVLSNSGSGSLAINGGIVENRYSGAAIGGNGSGSITVSAGRVYSAGGKAINYTGTGTITISGDEWNEADGTGTLIKTGETGVNCYALSATFGALNIEGGTIIGSVYATKGGNVSGGRIEAPNCPAMYLLTAVYHISGGTITSANTAEASASSLEGGYYPGTVFISDYGDTDTRLYISGGTITNTASGRPAVFNLSSRGISSDSPHTSDLYLSGTPSISGTTADIWTNSAVHAGDGMDSYTGGVLAVEFGGSITAGETVIAEGVSPGVNDNLFNLKNPGYCLKLKGIDLIISAPVASGLTVSASAKTPAQSGVVTISITPAAWNGKSVYYRIVSSAPEAPDEGESVTVSEWIQNTHGTAAFDVSAVNGRYIEAVETDASEKIVRWGVSNAVNDGYSASDSILDRSNANFDKDNPSDIAVSMTLNGNTLVDITSGAATLTKGNDYTVSGSTVTLKSTYFTGLNPGTVALVFHFSAGASQTVRVTVSDTASPVGIVSAFESLQSAVSAQSVSFATALEKLNLPGLLKATVDGISGSWVKVTEWISAISYNPLKAGTYDFTPVLDSGFTLKDSGVVVPHIRVTVNAKAEDHSDSNVLKTPQTAAPKTETKIDSSSNTSTVTTVPDSIINSDGTAKIDVTVPTVTTDTTGTSASLNTGAQARVSIGLPEDAIIQQFNAKQNVDLTLTVPSAAAQQTNSSTSVAIPVSTGVFTAAKASGTDLTISIKDADTQRLAYTWSFKGADLAKSTTPVTDINISMAIRLTTEVAKVNKLTPDNTGLVLMFDHSGTLPSTAGVTFSAKEKGFLPGQKLYFYFYNAAAGRLDSQAQEYTVGADGNVTVQINHCSDYVLLPNKARTITLDTRTYTMRPGESYVTAVKLTGVTGAKIKAYSSTRNVAAVTVLRNGNVKAVALKPGLTYIMIDVYDNKGKFLTHASVALTVRYGVNPSGNSARQYGLF